jgi:hypothetical protein
MQKTPPDAGFFLSIRKFLVLRNIIRDVEP